MLKQQRYGKEKNPEGLHSNSSTPSGLKYADISFQQQWVTKKVIQLATIYNVGYKLKLKPTIDQVINLVTAHSLDHFMVSNRVSESRKQRK